MITIVITVFVIFTATSIIVTILNVITVAFYTRGRGERSRDSRLAKKRIYVEVTRVLSKSRDRLTKRHYQLLKKSRKSPEYSQNRATVLQKETLT